MREVLISIQPKWCELIANGKKTIEVRKTRPKIETPFKCYIYCTLSGSNESFKEDCGGDIAEWNRSKMALKKGKVIGEFVCRNIYFLDESALFEGMDEISNSVIEEYSCLSIDELLAYKGNKQEIYGWSISDLVIYKKPKELSEFKPYCDKGCLDGKMCKHYEWVEWYGTDSCTRPRTIQRPPQSWCYVEKGGAE